MLGGNLSLWQDLETLQKRRTELEAQLNSSSDRAKTLEETLKAVEAELGVQEERVRRLEEQLKDRHEAMNKLESRIVGLEKILKKPNEEPVKETTKEEPVIEEPTMEETASEELSNDQFKVEPEEQPVEATVETAAGGSAQPQTEEIEQKESKRRRRWLQSR